jgi:hypothetical protein
MEVHSNFLKYLQKNGRYYSHQDPLLNVNETIRITNIINTGLLLDDHALNGKILAQCFKDSTFFIPIHGMNHSSKTLFIQIRTHP